MRDQPSPINSHMEPYTVVGRRLEQPAASSSILSSLEGSNFRPLHSLRQRTLSDAFYGTVDASQPVIQDAVKRMTTTQSKRLPGWAWWMLAKCLGIRLHPAERPVLGVILYALTVLLAALYILTFTWYTVYDIMSQYTKSTVLTGLAALIMAIYWGALGVYGNRLASKLFASESFLASVRLHSKTLFRISASGILAIIALVAMLLNDYQSALTYNTVKCTNISVSEHVCTTMVVARCSFSFVCWLWNILVAMVLLSVCRTHTIGIRRFITQLETDGWLYEGFKRQTYLRHQNLISHDTEDDYLWDEEGSALADDYRAFPSRSANPSIMGSAPNSPLQPRRQMPFRPSSPDLEEDSTDGEDEPLLDPSAPPIIVVHRDPDEPLDRNTTANRIEPSLQLPPRTDAEGQRRNAPSRASVDSAYTADSQSGYPGILSPDDIMLCYWRINCRLRTTSLALQRWLVAWVCFILMWSCSFLIWWISNKATLIGIAQFIFPILILPIVCSVYAEVNNEGKRMLKSICPMEERVTMMVMLSRQPLEMTVFGFPVNYSSILTFIGAVLLAFCSKIILEQFG